MTPLHSHLQTLLPLTVEKYMELCLYHPQYGYYTGGYNFTNPTTPLGHDFTTAPLLTPLFGATLGHWVATQWQILGQPPAFTLLEAGPGNGALMHALLTHLQTNHPTCYAACHPVLVETSPTLTQLQQKNLASFSNIRWRSQLTNPLPTLFLANELLDAFPIRQFAGTEERTVILHNNTLTFSHPNEAITHEDSPTMETWLTELKSLPTLKAALLIDYGYTTETQQPSTVNTLQALNTHQKVSSFHLPGHTDLTAHVNFTRVTQILGNHCTLTDLTPFLLKNSLLQTATALSAEALAKEDAALHRLLHPSQMGSLFKVLEFKSTFKTSL